MNNRFEKKLNVYIKRHIYSFLVEGNLDLIRRETKTENKEPNNSPSSTLSVIRRVSKDWKSATDIWQKKFKDCLLEDFKNISLRILSFKVNEPTIKNIMSTLFKSMNKDSSDSLIEMYKHVLEDCDNWVSEPVEPESKSHNAVTSYRFALQKLYVGLEEIRRSTYPSIDDVGVPSLGIYQNQFKQCLLEQIASLLFKPNQLHLNKRGKALGIIETKHSQNGRFTNCENRLFFLWFLVPSTAAFLLQDYSLPWSNRDPLRAACMIGLAFLTGFFFYFMRKDHLQRMQGRQRVQANVNNMLEEMDKNSAALNSDDELDDNTDANGSKLGFSFR